MRLKLLNFLKHNLITLVVSSALVLLMVFIFLLPSVQYRIGNIFFGEVPSLYNVKLAQYFFENAAHPWIGESPEYAHYQVSRTYFIQGRFKLSIASAERELKLYPGNVRTYYILGLTYGYVRREEEAILAFSKFIEHNQYSWAARNDKAWLQFKLGDIEGAHETIEPVSGNLNPWVQNTYGTVLLNMGRYEEAKVSFSRAQDLISDMTEEAWGYAYPGNDPRIYGDGLRAMKRSINSNLELLDEKTKKLSPYP